MNRLPPAPALYLFALSVPLAIYIAVGVAVDGWDGWAAIGVIVILVFLIPAVLLGGLTIASATSNPTEGAPSSSLSGWVVRDVILGVLSVMSAGAGFLALGLTIHESYLGILVVTGSYISLLPIGGYGLYRLARDLMRRRLSFGL